MSLLLSLLEVLSTDFIELSPLCKKRKKTKTLTKWEWTSLRPGMTPFSSDTEKIWTGGYIMRAITYPLFQFVEMCPEAFVLFLQCPLLFVEFMGLREE